LPQIIGKINQPVKSGKDHIFLRLGLLRSPYSAQKNVAYARTLCDTPCQRGSGTAGIRARLNGKEFCENDVNCSFSS
jgi:hypothetical protein